MLAGEVLTAEEKELLKPYLMSGFKTVCLTGDRNTLEFTKLSDKTGVVDGTYQLKEIHTYMRADRNKFLKMEKFKAYNLKAICE